MEVRPAGDSDVDACVGVLAALADHFTPDTHDDLRSRWGSSRTWVAVDGDEVVGFVSLEQRYPNGAEIPYAGVLPDRQRRGTGRLLVRRALDEAGVPVIEVKTLDASAGYEPYVATRAFWEAMGFVQVDSIDPLPGWQPGNPSAIYVCAVRAT